MVRDFSKTYQDCMIIQTRVLWAIYKSLGQISKPRRDVIINHQDLQRRRGSVNWFVSRFLSSFLLTSRKVDLWLGCRGTSPFYLLAQVREATKDEERREWGLQEATGTCLLDSGSIVLGSTPSAVPEQRGEWGLGKGKHWVVGCLGVHWKESVTKFCWVALGCVRVCMCVSVHVT